MRNTFLCLSPPKVDARGIMFWVVCPFEEPFDGSTSNLVHVCIYGKYDDMNRFGGHKVNGHQVTMELL